MVHVCKENRICRVCKGIVLVCCLIIIGSCATNTKKSEADVFTNDTWRKKAEHSQGFSPGAKKRKYDLMKNVTPVPSSTKRALPKKKISVKMNNTGVAIVLKTLAKAVDINLLVNESVTGNISLDVRDVPWDQVFRNVLQMQGLSYVQERHLIRILTDDDLAGELKRETLKRSLEQIEPLLIRVIKVNYADPVSLKDNLKEFVKGEQNEVGGAVGAERAKSSVSVDPHTNSLIVRAAKSEMARLLSIVEALDRPTRQVLIEANIIETNRSTARELGSQWSSTGGKVTAGMELPVTGGGFVGYTTTSGKNTLSLQLSALQTDGRLNILSSPSITTIDNKKAVIESGKEIPFQTIENDEVKIEYKKAVIRLEVTPHVIDDTTLKLIISTSKDEIDNSVEVNGNPGIITKRAETEVVLFNGQTTVIGGLNKDKDEENKRGIPWLMNLPFIGYVFKWVSNVDEMEELLIFITPKILEEYPHKGAAASDGAGDDMKEPYSGNTKDHS